MWWYERPRWEEGRKGGLVGGRIYVSCWRGRVVVMREGDEIGGIGDFDTSFVPGFWLLVWRDIERVKWR